MGMYRMRLVAGRNITPGDTVRDMVINETYARMLGMTDPRQAVGQYIDWQKKRVPVVGVVADFNQRSLHEVIRPLAIAGKASQEVTLNIGLRPAGETDPAGRQVQTDPLGSGRRRYPTGQRPSQR